jgi:hypothetical protein
MSCQRVNQKDTGETEQALRDRARIAACTDSGFTATNCPPDKVISVACKGDPPPTNQRAAGEALLKALKNNDSLVLTKDGTRLEKIKKEVGDTKDKVDATKAAPAEVDSTKPAATIDNKSK